MFLVGAYDLTLDVPKNRLSVPSPVRSEMKRIGQERAARSAAEAGTTEPRRSSEGASATAGVSKARSAGQDDDVGGAFFIKPGDREGVLELYEAGYYEQIRTLPVPMERLPRKDRELLTIEV